MSAHGMCPQKGVWLVQGRLCQEGGWWGRGDHQNHGGKAYVFRYFNEAQIMCWGVCYRNTQGSLGLYSATSIIRTPLSAHPGIPVSCENGDPLNWGPHSHGKMGNQVPIITVNWGPSNENGDPQC